MINADVGVAMTVAKEQALAARSEWSLRCFKCHSLVVKIDHDHAVAPGHIYSNAGLAEFFISHLCEYCFDEITVEPDA